MSVKSKHTTQRRRKILIEKDFQYRFTLKLCLLSGALFAISTGISLFFIKLSYEMLVQSALIQMPEMVDKLRWEFRTLSTGMLINWALFVGSIFALGVIYTQRIAGPIYAFRRKFQDFSRTLNPQKIKLRTHDEFHSLEESFNIGMETLGQHLNKLQQSTSRAQQLLMSNQTEEALKELNNTISEYEQKKP